MYFYVIKHNIVKHYKQISFIFYLLFSISFINMYTSGPCGDFCVIWAECKNSENHMKIARTKTLV